MTTPQLLRRLEFYTGAGSRRSFRVEKWLVTGTQQDLFQLIGGPFSVQSRRGSCGNGGCDVYRLSALA